MKRWEREQLNIIDWLNNSLQYMYKVLNTNNIPDECGIAIEYKIPVASRRVDFMLTGINEIYEEYTTKASVYTNGEVVRLHT